MIKKNIFGFGNKIFYQFENCFCIFLQWTLGKDVCVVIKNFGQWLKRCCFKLMIVLQQVLQQDGPEALGY